MGAKTVTLKPKEDDQVKRHMITTWDGDIYILTGYSSPGEIKAKIAGLEWVTMPNGAEIKTSSINKIQSYEDYEFQVEQKQRHKRGEYLGGANHDKWMNNTGGLIGEADVKRITGKIQNAPQLQQSTGAQLTAGKKRS